MNEMDVEDAARQFRDDPLLGPATKTLASLVDGVNGCSDGWPYWRAPARYAARLEDLIAQGQKHERERYQRPRTEAPTADQLKAAYRQLRTFRTKHPQCQFRIYGTGLVAHDQGMAVRGDPEPEPNPRELPVEIEITDAGTLRHLRIPGGVITPGLWRGTISEVRDA
jgi:hypothetical protein